MTARDRWIDRHLRRLHLGQFLQKAGEWLAVYLFVFGTAVLVVKLLIPSLWPHVLWMAAGVVPAAIAAWWVSRQAAFTRAESVALLDRSLRAGGLLMTLTEAPDDAWETHLPQVERKWQEALPRIRPRRSASTLIAPLLFALGACFVPLREGSATNVVKNTAGQQATQQLQSLLEQLEESAVLEEEERDRLEEAIAKLKEETEDSPLTHEKWETVDSLEQMMRMRLDGTHMDVEAAAQAASILAKAAAGDGPPLSQERQEQLEQDILETLQKLAKNGGLNGASSSLQSELQRLMKSGKLGKSGDSAARQELLNELQDFLEQESEKLSELRKQCQGGTCSKCGSSMCKDGQCEGEGQCSSCGAQCEGGLCSACSGGSPGRGGVTRGRGDAEMTWGDESDDAGTKFKETVLPPGLMDEPTDETVGVTRSAPEVEPAASATRAGVREIDPASGRETWSRTLRPRHRNVVRQFFDSNDKP